jgi:putative transposase
MSTPRHRTTQGISYFVATKCARGRSIFQVSENARILIEVLYRNREKGSFLLHEFVVMPNHLHLITPLDTTTLEKAIQLIKGGSSFEIHKQRNQKVETWQQGFHDWTIRDAPDWNSKSEYIALNPVRAGLVGSFKDWPYSSASGKFILDPMPERYLSVTSGAKAPNLNASVQGLKPLPPKELKEKPGDWRAAAGPNLFGKATHS